jgi:hypothetical protein
VEAVARSFQFIAFKGYEKTRECVLHPENVSFTTEQDSFTVRMCPSPLSMCPSPWKSGPSGPRKPHESVGL